MYRRDLRDTDADDLLADAASADAAVQAVPAPDGDRIAYAKRREGQTDLWLLADGRDRRLTSEGISAVRYGRGDPQWFDWSPDGDRIAFLDAEASLATVDLTTGAVRRLLPTDAADLGVAWSPDGDEIAVITDRFSRASLAVVGADGDRIAAVADDEFLYDDPRWSDDGDLYAVRARHRDLFDYESALVRASGGEAPAETAFREAGVRVRNPRPRPGGDEVAFVHDASGFDAVYSLPAGAVERGADAAEGDPERVYAVEGAEVADPAWNGTGERLAVTVTREGRVHARAVSPDADGDAGAESDAEALTAGKATHTAPRWIGDDVIAVRDDPTSPPAVRNASTGERLSPAGVLGFDERLVDPDDLSYESEGETIHAVVYPPRDGADPESVPLLVKAHGGPTSFDRFGWDYRAQYFAALGYAVICPNYRGSDGFGRAFRNANDRDWGGGDLADVIGAADAVADAYGAVDGDRAGVYGGSGGGLMTVNALGRSDRFRAGAAFYGVYDYETFADDTDDVGWMLMKRELGSLAADLDNYREASPIRRVDGIDDPLLVLHGEEDARVPISQSEQLVEELEARGKRHEFRRYEGEPHGFGDRENVVDAYTRVADLFAKYLREDPGHGGSRPHPPEG